MRTVIALSVLFASEVINPVSASRLENMLAECVIIGFAVFCDLVVEIRGWRHRRGIKKLQKANKNSKNNKT